MHSYCHSMLCIIPTNLITLTTKCTTLYINVHLITSSFPLLTVDWGAIEEVLLLDAVEQDRFGN